MDVDQILCLGSESATVKGSKQAESLSQTHILLDRIRELVTQQEGSTGEGSTGSLASNPELGWTLYRAVKLGVEHSVLEDALGGAALAPESQLKEAHDAWVEHGSHDKHAVVSESTEGDDSSLKPARGSYSARMSGRESFQVLRKAMLQGCMELPNGDRLSRDERVSEVCNISSSSIADRLSELSLCTTKLSAPRDSFVAMLKVEQLKQSIVDRIRELVIQQEGSTGSLASSPELGWILYRAVKLGVEHSVLEDALGGAAVAPESQLKKAHDAWVKILNASTCDRDSWDERAPPHRPNMQRGL